MYRKRNRCAQSTLEYAVLIVLVAVAILATQTYVKRGLQGRLKSSADDIGEQFSPGASNVSSTVTTNSSTRETSNSEETVSALTADETTTRTVNISIEAFNSFNEGWAGCGDGECRPPENDINCPADCLVT